MGNGTETNEENNSELSFCDWNCHLNFMFYSIAKGNYYASKISSNLVLFSDRSCEEPGACAG